MTLLLSLNISKLQHDVNGGVRILSQLRIKIFANHIIIKKFLLVIIYDLRIIDGHIIRYEWFTHLIL